MFRRKLAVVSSVAVCLAALLLAAAEPALSAERAVHPDKSYAWSHGGGWVNFRASHASAVVHEDHLSGYAWLEATGWIKLGADSGGPYANTGASDWGVNLDPASGELSGYAWSGAGWINFRPTHGGVSINREGYFTGYAWCESLGWTRFGDRDSATYELRTCTDGDWDCDGLADAVEDAGCADASDADSDDDGILDGAEDADGDGVVDSGETDPCSADTDGDGLQDGTESGLTLDDVWTDTDRALFVPDADPSTTTDPADPDSDRDGLTDGQEDSNFNGAVDEGETNPASSDLGGTACSLAGGSSSADFRIVSIGVLLHDASPSAALADQVEPYDPRQSRIGCWDSAAAAYDEWPFDADESLQPGWAGWFLFRDDRTLNFTGAPTPTTCGPHGEEGHAISIDEGWNMAGNPFAFPVSTADMLVIDQDGAYVYLMSPDNQITQPVFWVYEAGRYVGGSSLAVQEGGWIKKLTPGRGYLFVTARDEGAADRSQRYYPSSSWQRPPDPPRDGLEETPASSGMGGGGGCFVQQTGNR